MEKITETNKRNKWLDLIKLIASFMVVFIHVDFTGKFGYAVDAIARFAVPLFFAVSGFFSLNASAKTIKRRLLKLIALYLVASIIYHVYYAINVGFTEHFEKTFNILNFLGFIYLNLPFSSGHLWFLLALIYVYLIWLLVIKLSVKEKTLFIISVVCLVIHLILGELLTLFNIRFAPAVVRNFALMGFPFFTLGYLANKHQEKLKKTNNVVLILLIILGCLESALAYVFFDFNEIYVGSVCCVYALIVISIKLQEKPLGKFWVKLSSTSADVYVFHILISKVGISIAKAISISTESLIFKNVWPLIVCLVCVVLSLIKNVIVAKIKKRLE
ncbi:MAG: acyltransferase [Clostridia bacterium]|nr:acyltransferase [Clostridia bacterium]